MWKLFSENEKDPPVYLKVEKLEDVKITVTNYIKMWRIDFNNESMIQMMLKSNKGTETEDEQAFLEIGLKMLHDPKMLHEKMFTENQSGNLSVRLLCKVPIVLRMNFDLMLCSSEQFYQSITRPLLEAVNDLQNSEKKLRHHLIKKDGEIRGFMDMVPEGSPLMRCLRTEPYNDVKHMRMHSAADILFGTDPVEVSPKHIIQYGRPLPIQADESSNEETLPSREIKHALLSKPVKIEPTQSSQLTLKLQIPAVTSESLNNVVKSESNVNLEEVVKNEPIDTNDLNHNSTSGILETLTNELKDVTNKSGGDNVASLNNYLKGQNMYDRNATENTDNPELNNQRLQIDTDTHTQSSEQIQDLQVSNITERIKSESEQTIKKQTSCSPEIHPEQKPSTPKKRRKNLNY